jgi:hypothetical protein
VTVTVNGEKREFEVSGTPNSYPIIPAGAAAKGTLEVTLSPGLEAYSFTFG